jgi:hypothetical protein
MAPHLVRWHEEMGDKGLVVISLEDGRVTPVDAWRQRVESKAVPHPVLHDGAGANVARFEVRAYPVAYVIGRNGKVIWQGTPIRGLAEVERTIRSAVGA